MSNIIRNLLLNRCHDTDDYYSGCINIYTPIKLDLQRVILKGMENKN